MSPSTATRARLGPRLGALLDLCPVEGPVADVGSGHGRLAFELARRLPPGQVYATEAKAGPAAELRRLLGGDPTVTILEGQGLTPLRQLGCRGAVLAGMGGRTLVDILETDRDVLAELSWVCLQPMQRVERLVDWIGKQSGWVVRTNSTRERGHFYSGFLLMRQ